MSQRQQVVAGGNAGAAVEDSFGGGCWAKRGLELDAEGFGGEESAVFIQIAFEWVVDRARDVSRNRVERLDVTPIPFWGAGIDQERSLENGRFEDEPVAVGLSNEGGGGVLFDSGGCWISGFCPGFPAAIQKGHVFMAHVAQQPPEPRGNAAARIIVGDDLFAVVDSEAGEGIS